VEVEDLHCSGSFFAGSGSLRGNAPPSWSCVRGVHGRPWKAPVSPCGDTGEGAYVSWGAHVSSGARPHMPQEPPFTQPWQPGAVHLIIYSHHHRSRGLTPMYPIWFAP